MLSSHATNQGTYSAATRLPPTLFKLAEDLEKQTMAKGIILLGLPVPSRKGKVTLFQLVTNNLMLVAIK